MAKKPIFPGAADLKPIYRAATEAEAEQALRAFEQKWDRKYPTISKSWRTHWPVPHQNRRLWPHLGG